MKIFRPIEHKKTLVLALVFISNIAMAQVTQKMPFELYKISMEAKEQNAPAEQVQNQHYVFIKGDTSAIQQMMLNRGGSIVRTTGSVVRGYLPVNALQDIAATQAVELIESGMLENNISADADSLLYRTGAIKAHNGLDFGLSRNYKGSGVLIGIVETGIDLRHADFRNADGTTRVYKLWDFNSAGTPPPGFNRGNLIDSSYINAGLRNNTALPIDDNGHGTSVVGLAAGNGNASGAYTGIAPKATIMIADLTPSYYTADIIDAVAYFFEEADRLNMPCVVNISYGNTLGPHDGTDSYSMVLDYLVNQKNGRAIVVASGNDGDDKVHLSYPVTQDTTFTWFNRTKANINFQGYMSKTDFDNVSFTFGADTLNTLTGKYDYVGNIGFKTALNNPVIDQELYTTSGKLMGRIINYIFNYDSLTYAVNSSIYPATGVTAKWRFTTTGNGTVNFWNRDTRATEYDSTVVNQSPEKNKYHYPDDEMSVGGYYNSARNVITVGAYTNINTWQSHNGTTQYRTWTQIGEMASYSSQGPTRDGRNKPDIMAPGQFVVSPKLSTLGLTNSIVGAQQQHIVSNGTSFASPIVAGAVALIFEIFPNASHLDVKANLNQAVQIDAFTTSIVPNNKWGAGKLDVGKLVRNGEMTSSGILDVTLVDFNALKQDNKVILKWVSANEFNADKFVVERSTNARDFDAIGEVKAIGFSTTTQNYSFMDDEPVNGTNFYRLKMVDFDKKTSYSKMRMIEFEQIRAFSTQLYPNPYAESFNVVVAGSQANVAIYDTMGKMVFSCQLTEGIHNLNPQISKGLYFVQTKNINTDEVIMSKLVKM